jgi:hypothetical protein
MDLLTSILALFTLSLVSLIVSVLRAGDLDALPSPQLAER